jgi:hypothetical protein
MSITIDIRKEFADGNPIVFWRNRVSPFRVGGMRVAHSGKIAMVRKAISDDIGKVMSLTYRLARRSHISTWEGMINDDPFNTTEIVDYLETGYKVIFAIRNPIIEPQGEVIQSFDMDQNIFQSAHGRYRKGMDLFLGQLNLVIVDTV